jgi:hypothetical protein
MPATTEENAPIAIVDPTSATGEEIDPSVDRDRIRVVCVSVVDATFVILTNDSYLEPQRPLHHFKSTARITR